MKKNVMMRVASALLVAVLMTTCAISGTFAKYTTSVTSNDSARVAKWGFGTATIEFENLFDKAYTNVTAGSDEMAIIAPGTSGEVSFKFEKTAAPEVAYTFVVSTEGSACAAQIQANTNITWSLDGVACANWTDLLAKIEALDGDTTYAAGELPAEFNDNQSHTISWNWKFDGDDAMDTNLGDLAVAGDLVVTLKVSITATQQ